MKIPRWALRVGLVLAAGPAFAGPSECGLPEMTGVRDLQRFLSNRAVEVVRRAASADGDLTGLVASSANFSLGGGDVRRALGMGAEGARELARTMKADSYRFLGWDYMDMPADACGKYKIKVEFTDSKRKNVSQVEFTFEAGRVTGADGWERSFETGRL